MGIWGRKMKTYFWSGEFLRMPSGVKELSDVDLMTLVGVGFGRVFFL
jgi:hypothetical protein